MNGPSLEIPLGAGNPNGLHISRNTPESHWKSPLALAIAFHLITFLVAILSPMFYKRPPLPEIYSVTLFNATEVSQPQPPVKEIEKPEAEKISPPVAESKPAPKAPVKAISLKPLKTKKKIKKEVKPEPKIQDDVLARALDRVKAKVNEKEAKERANEAVEKAVSSLRQSLHAQRIGSSDANSGPTTGAKGNVSEMPEVMRRYYADLILHIQQYWRLPYTQDWDENLEALMVILINRDGIVKKNYLERKSKNVFFDRFVKKAIQDASPMPPFPPDLLEKELEVGLRFKPGELF